MCFLQIEDDDIENSPMVEKIRQERGYNYKDVITVSPEKLENYEAKVGALLLQNLARKGYFSKNL